MASVLQNLTRKAMTIVPSYASIDSKESEVKVNKPDYSSLMNLGVAGIVGLSSQSLPSNTLTNLSFIDANVIQGKTVRSADKKTVFDLEHSYFKLSDGDNTRFYAAGKDGVAKGSDVGYDADTTGNEHLAFSTEFTQISSDWINYSSNASPYYVSATRIGFNNYDPTQRLTQGDKVRYKQGGDYKYGYILWVKSTYIEVYGGSTYSVSNADITDFGVSRAERPSGFLYLLPYSATWSKSSGAGSFTFPASVSGFYMRGNLITAMGYIDGVQYSSAAAGTLKVTMPTADFVYGDTNSDSVIDLTDASIAISNIFADTALFREITGSSSYPLTYIDGSATPLGKSAYGIYSAKATGSDTYLSDPSLLFINPMQNLPATTDLTFSFNVTYMIDYYGP